VQYRVTVPVTYGQGSSLILLQILGTFSFRPRFRNVATFRL
jgi:hypothetical protein